MAIITDIFTMQERGRVMGFIQMGFGASQVLGLPIGLYLANWWGWNAPFFMIGGMAIIIAFLIITKLQPLTKHLAVQQDKSALKHLLHTVAKRNYRIGFLATAFLSIGGFMMMPFGSAFAINNLRITNQQLPIIYMVSGVCSLIVMPIIGRFSDKIDKFKIFTAASIWMMVMVLIYTNLSATPLWLVLILNVLMMTGIMSRMIPSSALTSAMPDMADRGAFMSINSSLQQIAGGIAAAFAGIIVVQKTKAAPLEHYNTLGLVIIGISVLSIFLLSRVSVLIKQKKKTGNVVLENEPVVHEMG
jgi:predicted MFS family arabinose efflux permease